MVVTLTVHLSLNNWWVPDSWVGLHAFDSVSCGWLLGLICLLFFSPRLNRAPSLDWIYSTGAGGCNGSSCSHTQGLQVSMLWTRGSWWTEYVLTNVLCSRPEMLQTLLHARILLTERFGRSVCWRRGSDLSFLSAWCKSSIKLLERPPFVSWVCPGFKHILESISCDGFQLCSEINNWPLTLVCKRPTQPD